MLIAMPPLTQPGRFGVAGLPLNKMPGRMGDLNIEPIPGHEAAGTNACSIW